MNRESQEITPEKFPLTGSESTAYGQPPSRRGTGERNMRRHTCSLIRGNGMTIRLIALSLLLLSFKAVGTDCGAWRFKSQLLESAGSVLRTVPVERTFGEFSTTTGTRECLRVGFRISPWGTAYDVTELESSGNLAFNLAAFRAFRRYELAGSFFKFWQRKMVLINGVDNRLPAQPARDR